tara:strand:+ start:4390 stop:5610 length:1221 start_codon:yes stop_codon:yes gene_type:complete
MTFKLRDYQQKFSIKGLEILNKHKILILNLEVRTGKSHIALDIGKNYNSVLFVTKKKAIQSVLDDYETAGHSFDIIVTNYENLHKIQGKFDLVICDESNEKISAYPKPTLNAKRVKEFVNNDLILLTGTLLPESNSQIFHQLWVSKYSPFAKYKNFYAFHKSLGIPKILYTSYGQAKDYSDVPFKKIKPFLDKIKISFTQEESGFKAVINEVIHRVNMKPITINLMNRLKKDLLVQGKDEVILADSGVKLMSKLHQLASGTVKFESGNSSIIDRSKIDYILEKFANKKVAIFYKFKSELDMIKESFDLAKDISEFDNSDKCIAFQFISGRSGIKLDKADCIIALNIDYSATTYFQFRARMITSNTKQCDLHWIFSQCGFEHKVYKSVMNKKQYTLNTFKKDVKIPN